MFAIVALAAGGFVSGPKAAAPLCGSKQCAEEIAAACAGLSGACFKACKKLVLDQCKISGETFCSCTNPALPACPGPTTPPSACCTQSTPGGPFDQCTIATLCECSRAGGIFRPFQTCTPNPCETTTTTTTSTITTTTTLAPVCGNGIREPGEQCDGADLGDCASGGFSCRPAGVSGECECCSNSGPFTQLVGCCNPSSILIPAPGSGGTCVATRCDPPFSCTGNDLCQADGSCCSPPGETCLVAVISPPIALNACCGVAECRGPSPSGLSCCVPDAASCSTDAECCTGHCTSGSCDVCRAGGAACANPFECCSLSCTSGTCDACAAGGSGCISGTTCCSGVCDPSSLTCVG